MSYTDDHRVSAEELLAMALEALKRNGLYTEPMHPEDWAAALCPAIESVAVGYGEGYRRGLNHGRTSE